MRAVRFHRYGDPSVLRIEELAVPQPKQGEVRVRVVGSSLNSADINGRQGKGRPIHAGTLPHTPGYDIAGEIDMCGPGVSAFMVGERVYGLTGLHAGGQAEYVCIATDRIARTPTSIELTAAAAVPLAGMTALQGLRRKANVQAGQRLLVNGAAGGVGSFAVQLGKLFGCHVTAVCRTSKAAAIRELGADDVIDFSREDFAKRPQTWDVVFDAAGNRSLRDVQAVLAPGGIMVATRPTPTSFVVSALGFGMPRPHFSFVITQASGQDMALLTHLIDIGQLRPLLDRTFPLDDIQAAHRYYEQGGVVGKVLVQVA